MRFLTPKGDAYLLFYYSSLTLAELKRKSLVYLLRERRSTRKNIANLIYTLARGKNEYLKQGKTKREHVYVKREKQTFEYTNVKLRKQ